MSIKWYFFLPLFFPHQRFSFVFAFFLTPLQTRMCRRTAALPNRHRRRVCNNRSPEPYADTNDREKRQAKKKKKGSEFSGHKQDVLLWCDERERAGLGGTTHSCFEYLRIETRVIRPRNTRSTSMMKPNLRAVLCPVNAMLREDELCGRWGESVCTCVAEGARNIRWNGESDRSGVMNENRKQENRKTDRTLIWIPPTQTYSHPLLLLRCWDRDPCGLLGVLLEFHNAFWHRLVSKAQRQWQIGFSISLASWS